MAPRTVNSLGVDLAKPESRPWAFLKWSPFEAWLPGYLA